jgi:hypothetical protein
MGAGDSVTDDGAGGAVEATLIGLGCFGACHGKDAAGKMRAV